MAKVFQVDTGGTLTTNLVAYYKTEDVTEYYIGGGTLDFTNNNSGTFSTGKISNASNYGSANDTDKKHLTVSNDLGIAGNTMSVACWINVTTAPGTNKNNGFFYQNDGDNDVSFVAAYRDVSGTKYLSWNRRRNDIQDNWQNYAVTLTGGTLYHVVLTYDGTNIRGYYNGSLVIGPTSLTGTGSGTDPDAFSLG